MMVMEAVRLRVLFKDKDLLTESLTGLSRSWIVLKPHLRTISDLSAYILSVFLLDDACPNGLILSMDGFVLPPFESVCILKDKDIVRVKKKKSKAISLSDGNGLIETEEFRERKPVDKGVKLLADKEFENESNGYETQSEEDEPNATLPVKSVPVEKKVSKKRKASKIIRNSKRKKNKRSPSEEFPTIVADVQHANEKREERNHLKSNLLQKVLVSKNDSTSSSSKCELDTSSSLEIEGRSNNIIKSTNNAERVDQLGAGGRHVELSDTAGDSKKGPSRSSRRKKAKRRWLRERAQNEEQQLFETSLDQGASQNDDVDMDDDTVPVVVKPGHIRFEPVGKVITDQARQQKQNHFPKETLHWNGITNKKKGQKWGKEKTPSWKRNNSNNCTGEPLQLPSSETEQPKTPVPVAGPINFDGEPLQLPSSETEQPKTPVPVAGPINFDELQPCTGLPQEGDLIAYRLIELSSTWTPEISSFRAGKVSWYEADSNRIMLIPVPEYPLPVKKEIEEDSELHLDTTPYGEDGSLKIDFASLVDLRLIRQGNLDSSRTAVNQEIISTKQTVESSKLVQINGDANDTRQGNGKVSAWDEISEALSAKKAELSKNDGWNQEESSGRRSWSYRALRGSALGPTMALLRAQNEL
ncbi:coilin isoform X2 [Benincasa hispida]|uniref:coilin isoform X2 n=1 Tax=Benincasa hispida TaxID=102211 RepID=UPI0018FFE2A0|nr:coilin isoform X2 [Benincasa hispida]